MKKAVFLLGGILLVFLLSGCVGEGDNLKPNNTAGTEEPINKTTEEKSADQGSLVGGDKDEHGCIGSAGYTWCPSKEKCLKIWEEYCEEYKENFRGESSEN